MKKIINFVKGLDTEEKLFGSFIAFWWLLSMVVITAIVMGW